MGYKNLMFPFVPSWDATQLVFMDRWSWLFVGLILGIGALIVPYSLAYFDSWRYRLKFLAAFFPFMLSMLGVVVLDHLLLFFVCWELTSLLSYFLISFKPDQEGARRAALHTALITGAGGLCLLGGILLLGIQGGVWTFSGLLETDFLNLPSGPTIAGLFLVAALTKSAQFPFNFWLPKAMFAPTPASAYLHSATMVKAGVFLIYRVEPVMGAIDWFNPTIGLLGMITFSLGSVLAIFQMDLKGVLASTTLANLGLIAVLASNPFPGARDAACLVVLGHALYKAGLFLFAGVIEHSAHTRVLERLSGLGRYYPKTAAVGLILTGANMGLPFTVSYYAKSSLPWPEEFSYWVLLGSLFLAKAGILVAVKPFLGRIHGISHEELEAHPPSPVMMLGPFVLAILSWTLPLASSLWAPTLGLPGFSIVMGSALVKALAVAAASIILYQFWNTKWTQWWNQNTLPATDYLFDRLWFGHISMVGVLSRGIQNGSLAFYLAVPVVLLAVSIPLFWRLPAFEVPKMDLLLGLLLVFFGIQWWASLRLIRVKSAIPGVLFLGAAGFALAQIFSMLGAPDLALTQFSIECLSILLLALVFRSVKGFVPERKRDRFGKGILALAAGTLVGIAVFTAASHQVGSRLAGFFGEKSWVEAHGRNVVNVILVDFRGVDTLGEISVLVIAALGVLTLVKKVAS